MDDTTRAETANPSIAAVIMYSTPWCGYCRRLKRALARRGVGIREIDLDKYPEHASKIERLTGGNRTVPTVQVGDDVLLVNPSADEVLAAIRSQV